LLERLLQHPVERCERQRGVESGGERQPASVGHEPLPREGPVGDRAREKAVAATDVEHHSSDENDRAAMASVIIVRCSPLTSA
jgi:hypothetical protein